MRSHRWEVAGAFGWQSPAGVNAQEQGPGQRTETGDEARTGTNCPVLL